MPEATFSNEQFLLCAIDNTSGGTVDWQKVADVFGIKKNAAYMRYNRMKAKHGTYPGGGTSTSSNGQGAANDDDDEGTKPKPTKKSTPKKMPATKPKASKKRRIDEISEDAGMEQGDKVKEEPVEEAEDLEDVSK